MRYFYSWLDIREIDHGGQGKSFTRDIKGKKLHLCKFRLKRGLHIKKHNHPNEQITYVIKGSIKMRIGNETMAMKSGDVAYVPSFSDHEIKVLEDTVGIDSFTPIRIYDE